MSNTLFCPERRPVLFRSSRIAALFVLAVALLLGGVRLGFLWLDRNSELLAELLSEALEQPVSIGQVNVTWRALIPEIAASQVVIGPTEAPLITLERILVGFDLPAALRSGEPHFRGISLAGLSLTLRREAAGEWRLLGSDRASEVESGSGDWLQLLERLDYLSLLDSRIRFEDVSSGRAAELIDTELGLIRAGDRLHAHLRGRFPGAIMEPVEITLELAAPEGLAQIRRGRGHLRVAGADLAVLSRWQQELPLGDGELDLDAWWSFSQRGLEALYLEPRLRHYRGYHLRQGRFRVELEHPGWQLTARDLRIDHNATPLIEATRLGLRDGQLSELAVPRLELAPLLAALRTLAPDRLPEPLRHPATSLQGDLSEIEFSSADGEGELNGRLRFAQLGLEGDGLAVAGLAGELRWIDGAAELEIDSQAVTISAPEILAQSQQWDSITAQLRVAPSDRGVEIDARTLRLENQDMTLRARARVELPAEGSPWIDAQTTIDRLEAARIRDYLPAGVMSPRAVEWLNRGLVAGEIEQARALIRGPLESAPFYHQEGRFEALIRARRGVVDFKPGWPRIHGGHVTARFEGPGMRVEVNGSQLLDGTIETATVNVRDLDDTVLEIKGKGRGPMSNLLYLARHPLAHKLGFLPDDMRGEGEIGVDLDMNIPLDENKQDRVSGRIHFLGTELRSDSWLLDLASLRGAIRFKNDRVDSDQLRAVSHGRSFRVTLDSNPNYKAGEQLTEVRAWGPLPVRTVARQLGVELDPYLAGRSDWRLELTARDRLDIEVNTHLTLELTSDLRGLTVKLPAPLAKPAEQPLPFQLSISHRHGYWGQLQLRYGERGRALLAFAQSDHEHGGLRILRGAIRMGQQTPTLPPAQRLTIGGRVPHYSWSEWEPWLLQGEGNERIWPPMVIKSEVDDLELLGQQINNAQVEVTEQPHGWQLSLNGEELAGSAYLPKQLEQPIRADLERLRLHPHPLQERQNATSPAPQSLPPLIATSRSVEIDDVRFTDVRLRTRPSERGQEIEQLDAKLSSLALKASGLWSREAADDRTELRVIGTTPDLGALLEELALSRALEGGESRVDLRLDWAAPPYAFDLAHLEGVGSLRIGAGSLIEVNPGAGRVLNLLRLEALPRRLALDFGDLFEKGFNFERIKGALTLRAGRVASEKLEIRGPLARVEIEGEADLIKQQLDQRWSVYPEITSSVSVVGALAGGVQLGAALYVAQKALQGSSPGLARVVYRVSGPWTEPQILLIQQDEESID